MVNGDDKELKSCCKNESIFAIQPTRNSERLNSIAMRLGAMQMLLT